MKSPGNSGPPPDMPSPQGQQTPYGFASQFNPQYSSFLPADPMASAQLGDPTRQEFGAPTQLLEQQRAAPIAGPQASAGGQDLKKMLASLMAIQNKQDRKYKGGSGSHGGGRG